MEFAKYLAILNKQFGGLLIFFVAKLLLSIIATEGTSISDADMGLTEDTFRIVGRVGETAPERYSIGTNIYFEINLTPTIALQDEVSLQLTSFINGYSSLVFCGDPAFDSLSPVQSWEVFALDQISPYVSFWVFLIWPTCWNVWITSIYKFLRWEAQQEILSTGNQNSNE